LDGNVRRRTAVVAASATARDVRVTVRRTDGTHTSVHGDYLILTVPATTLRHIAIEPPLSPEQQAAIEHLRYGPASRSVLQFDRRFWHAHKWRAFGTTLPIGAVWDGNEEQEGTAGILSFLAGGSASAETQKLLAGAGAKGLIPYVEWLHPVESRLLASHTISWEDDPWAQGGYACFDPAYDPALRAWLARPHGRILFAGEHTSIRWQGYMNGAVESGLRAAAEVAALVQQDRKRD
jgi:monoamine oxidase